MRDLNQIARGDSSRTPRSLVRLNDTDFKPTSWVSTSNTHYQANTAEVEFALGALSASQQVSFWADQKSVKVEIYVGLLRGSSDPDEYTSSDLERIFYGEVDDVQIDLVQQTVKLRCRDLTGRFIDHTTTEKYKDMSASAIAEKLAKDRGLKSRVVETTILAGAIYKDQHTLLDTERTEWDLITYLAQSEGYLAYVDVETLVFVPRGGGTGGTYRIVWEPATSATPQWSNAIRLSASRSLSLSREVVVKVRSWNRQKKKGFTETVTAASPTRPKSRGGTATTHVIRRGGLTREQAIKLGEKKLKEITDHEIRVEATLPGDSLIKPETTIRLEGSGSRLDQNYFVDNVTRKFDFQTGYTMDLKMKNSSTYEQVIG